MDPKTKMFVVEGLTEPPPPHHLPFLYRVAETRQRYETTVSLTLWVMICTFLFSLSGDDARSLLRAVLAMLLFESAWRGLQAWFAWKTLQGIRQAERP